jgi:hypothetical protein
VSLSLVWTVQGPLVVGYFIPLWRLLLCITYILSLL